MRGALVRLALAVSVGACMAWTGAGASAMDPSAATQPSGRGTAAAPERSPAQGRLRGGTPRSRARPEPAKPAPPAPVRVTTSLSRTAVWTGDPVVWTVEIACAPGFDVIVDDFAGDKVGLVGLELVSSEVQQATSSEGAIVHRARFNLRSFSTRSPMLRTEPLKVRYFERQAGQRAEDLTPAGEVVIPPARIAWRSAIPEGSFEDGVFLRDARPSDPAPAFFAVARQIGMSLLLVSVAPVVLWVSSKVHDARKPRQRRPSARATRNETRNALNVLRTSGPSTEQELRVAYTRLSETLRQYVSAATGVPGSALVSHEIASRLSRPGSRVSGESVAEVLAECDRARYSPPGRVPPAERFRDSLDAAERLL